MGHPADPAFAYMRQLDQPQAFSLQTDRPHLTAQLHDCAVPAKLIDVQILSETPRGDREIDYEFEATQKLLADLYNLESSLALRKAINWDNDRLNAARSEARRLPQPHISDLSRRWSAAQASRAYVMEVVHRRGTRSIVTGKVRATSDGSAWQYEITRLRPRERFSSRLVTAEKFPPGLIAVDPEDYQGAAAEWSQPYEEFIAAVEQAQAAAAAASDRQRERLGELITAGSAWTTRVEGRMQAGDLRLQIDRISESGIYSGRFILSAGGQGSDTPVFGFYSKLRSDDPEALRAQVPPELLGHVILMQPDRPEDLPPPWNELKFYFAARPDDRTPTLIWLNKVYPLSAAD